MSVQQTSFFATISASAKSFAADAGDLFARVWSSVAEFFSNAGQTLGQWVGLAREALVAAKETFVALPTNVKIVGGVTALVAVLAGCVLGKYCGSAQTAATQAATSAATGATAASTAVTAAATSAVTAATSAVTAATSAVTAATSAVTAVTAATSAVTAATTV
ncbi:MAG: hypothetical protein KGQ49_02560 [Verrucomicrobia bacterium]|nr:hypothetical protein [Verrucomicrobiota bacterium]